MAKQKSDENIHVRVSRELKTRIEAAAEREQRSVANWLLTLIVERLDKAGARAQK